MALVALFMALLALFMALGRGVNPREKGIRTLYIFKEKDSLFLYSRTDPLLCEFTKSAFL